MSNRFWLRFALYRDGDRREYSITGKVALTLWHLKEEGFVGITALGMSNTWALRLAHYVFVLRKKYGLDIETKREAHQDGWHARYVLIEPVELLESRNNNDTE